MSTENKKPIRISEVLELLKEGKKRPEVAEALNISMRECRELFKHPKLKGLQARKPVGFTIVDDLEDDGEETVETTSDVKNTLVNAEEVSSEEETTGEAEMSEGETEQEEGLPTEKPSWS